MSLKDQIIRPLLGIAGDIRKATGTRPLIRIAISGEVFRALENELAPMALHEREPGESEMMRIAGGIVVESFDALKAREDRKDFGL